MSSKASFIILTVPKEVFLLRFSTTMQSSLVMHNAFPTVDNDLMSMPTSGSVKLHGAQLRGLQPFILERDSYKNYL